MKKTLNLLMGILLTLFLSVPLFAADTIGVYMDEHKVAVESYMLSVGDHEGKYYMDVLPQIKNDRIYVPISTITKFLGANISWKNPNILINHNNTKLILTVGETGAIRNSQPIELDAPPYVDKGRTLVPLRFVSEALGLGVTYQNDRVDITSPNLKVNDVQIDAIQTEFSMTMGSVVSESKTNICMSRIYEEFQTNKANVMEIPSAFGSHNDIDSLDYYYELREYRFSDSSNNIVTQYKIYSHQSFGNSTGRYAIEDVINSEWYSITEEDFCTIIDLENIGEWTVVSDTIV